MRAMIPNLVTASRGVIGLIVVVLLLGPGPDRLAFWLFVVAIFTDLIDGWLARVLDATSTLGHWLDPISDKVLTDACWIALWYAGWAPGWLAGLMLFRDLCVTVGFIWTWRRGGDYEANLVGRVGISFEGTALAVLLFHGPWLGVDWVAVGTAIGVITLALSLASLAQYIVLGPVARRAQQQ